MLCDLLYAKRYMHSVCYISNDYLQNCVYLYSVPLLQHSIGSLFADVADFCDKCLSVVKSSWPRG